jgi:hypothetical protein
MENNVVMALKEAFTRLGWGALRFNFRGVGQSGGTYGDGEGEAQDIQAVWDCLRAADHESSLHLAAYSFGVWAGLKAVHKGLLPKSLFLISPPLDFLDFSGLWLPLAPTLIVMGDRDEFCSVQSLRSWLADGPGARQDLTVKIIPKCNHFFVSREEALVDEVSQFVRAYAGFYGFLDE